MTQALTIRALATLAAMLAGSAALAHEFTAALLVTGENRETRLADAVNGFLLAADESDGHAGETSDGHLGGVDVQVLPLPAEATGRVAGLAGSPADRAGVVVVLGPAPTDLPDMAAIGPGTVVMGPGALAQDWSDDTGAGGFADRYRRAYGADPTEAAAQGYNAARRLDLAVRPLDGLDPAAALRAALAETEEGIEW